MADEPLIFLSYASQDRDRVQPFYDHLKASGLNVWMDKHNLKGGQNWDVEIKKAIQRAAIIVVFLSNQSVNKRGYVQREIKIALDQAQAKLLDDIYLIPVQLEADTPIPDQLSHIHCISAGQDEMYDALRASIYDQLERLGSTVSVFQSAQPISWSTRTHEEVWEGLPGYEVKLDFIDLKSTKFLNIAEVNDVIRGWLIDSLHSERRVKFQQDPDVFSFGQDRYQRTNTWEAAYSDPVVTGATLSILYSVSWYGAGAAHPNYHFKSFCFSLEPLVGINSLRDVFDDRDLGLQQLRSYTRKHILSAQGEDGELPFNREWVESGTADWTSFDAFSFRDDGIEIFFPPYQVASYAAGSYSVVVPYTELVAYMDKNFQHLLGIAYLKTRLGMQLRSPST